jgi:hypothetical protein
VMLASMLNDIDWNFLGGNGAVSRVFSAFYKSNLTKPAESRSPRK